MRTRTAALAALAAAATVVPALAVLAAPAVAANTGQVCVALDSGKIDTKGDPQSVTVYAPAGQLITGYCVKAGSIKQGDGPVNVKLSTPVSSLVITHPSGKAVSHYSVAYGTSVPVTPTDPETDPETPTDPETDPETPTDPGTDPETPTDPGTDPETPTDPETDPETEFPEDPAPALEPWSWDWQYAAPTCDALTVSYPANLPSGQANDANIRIRTNQGEVTLNFHNNEGTWAGTTGFTYSQHRNWPAGVTSYTVTWVQVAGTNYHWQGALDCRILSDGDAATLDAPLAVTSIAGFNSAAVKLVTGAAVAADAVTIKQTGLETVVLQRQAQGVWRSVKTVATAAGTVRVTFPKETKPGTYAYRLVAPRSESVTGAVTKSLVVKVAKKKR